MSFIKAKDLDKLNKWPNPYGLTKKDSKGKIKDWPLEIITLVLKEMEIQNGKYDLDLLQNKGLSHSILWSKAQEGVRFWGYLEDNFNLFYDLYTPEKLKERLEK